MKDLVKPGLLDELGQELRGPLSAISEHVQVLQSEGADREARASALSRIALEVRTMSLLLERLQATASPLAGRGAAIGPVDIVSFLKGLLIANGGEVRLDASEPALEVLADPVWLKQMFRPFLSREQIGAPFPTQAISIATAGSMTEIALETQKQQPFVVALVRAMAVCQGGECLDTALADRTLLRFRLRPAR